MNIVLPEMLSLRTLLSAVTAGSGRRHDSEQNGTYIDLSLVEFADLGALAEILLIIEAAARSHTKVGVTLPIPLPLEAEQPTSANTAAAIRRAGCLQFLRATGFVSAALLPHLPDTAVEISSPGDWSMSVHEASSDFARILTFRWLVPGQGELLWRSDGLVAAIRGLRGIGMSNRDAQLLVNHVLFELIENVAAHAADRRLISQPHVLVGAIAVDTNRLPPVSSLPSPLVPLLEWSHDSTMIRMVVGDSGIGLARHLLPHAPSDLLTSRSGAASAEASWTAEEKVTLWALDRWSTSAESTLGRGTRGLWRAQRAVRSFDASAMTIHTADAAAGYIFMEGPETVRMPDSTAALGTLIDVRLLPGARPTRPAAKATAKTTAPGAAISPQWMRMTHAEEDAAVLAAAEASVKAGHHLLLTVDGGPDHHLSHERLVNILARASELANPAVVTVLVTGTDPVAIDAGVDALHNPPPSTVIDASDPFLLIDSTGHQRWCGGSGTTRELLNQLAEEPFPLNGNADLTGELRALAADQSNLVQRTGDSVRLAIHAADVVTKMEQIATEALSKALESGPGVHAGAFRTPNLHLTNRWVEVDVVVERALGTGIAGFLLAQKLARAVPTSAVNGSKLVLVGEPVRDLSKLLAESAQFEGGIYEMLEDGSPSTPSEPLAPETKTVLCADILLTENNVVQVAKQILGWRAVPVAVIVPLDAREHDGAIEVASTKIPVISLARASSGSETIDASEVIDADPIFGKPAGKQDPPSHGYRWPTEQFLTNCLELPWVVGLGHLVRPADRHFTAYFDASRLIDPSSRMRESLADAMVESVIEWIGDTRKANPGVVICHAGSSDGYARRLAGLLSRHLAPRIGLPNPITPVAVQRRVTGAQYAFPQAVEGMLGSDVVIVDWGSFDATTVLQLTRLAAENGARRIFTFVLLSQLSEHDERALNMIRSVAGPSTDAPDVPTVVRFLTWVGISPLTRGDCTLCRMAHEMRSDASYGKLPRELAQHALAMAGSLVPLNRDQAAERTVDAFGAPATTQDAIAYIRLRGMMLKALRSTATAAELAAEITALADTPHAQSSHALIRLLAAEQQWLTQRPVRLTLCLKDVATLAAQMMQDQQLHSRLRLQALVVLASAAPEVLVSHFRRLWRSSLDQDELLRHMLYQAWVGVRAGFRESMARWADLREHLADCLTIEQDAYASSESAEEAQYLMTRLLSELDWRQVDTVRLAPQEAWARLREYYLFYLDRHSDAERALINLLIFLGDGPPPPGDIIDDALWQTMLRSWNTVAAFLKDNVLAYTGPLAQILAGAFAQEHFDRAQLARLDELTTPLIFNEVGDLAWRIGQLRQDPSEDADLLENWHDVVNRLNGWYRTVLSAGADRPRADLAEFLGPCPAPLMATLLECIEIADKKQALPVDIQVIAADDGERQVFIHKDLLRDAIQQIIDNAVKPSHRRPEVKHLVVDMTIDVEIAAPKARLLCRNKGTTPSTTRPGKGIVSMNRKLEDFGAAMIPSPVPPEGWSYQIELELLLWSHLDTNAEQQ